jgi:hypothetical protein
MHVLFIPFLVIITKSLAAWLGSIASLIVVVLMSSSIYSSGIFPGMIHFLSLF